MAAELGHASACVGEDRYANVPVIAPGARAGDPTVIRLPRALTVRYARGARGGRNRWRLAPRCDVFGCRTTVRSSGGLRGTLRPIGAGLYEMRTRERVGYCQVTYIDGQRQRFGIIPPSASPAPAEAGTPWGGHALGRHPHGGLFACPLMTSAFARAGAANANEFARRPEGTSKSFGLGDTVSPGGAGGDAIKLRGHRPPSEQRLAQGASSIIAQAGR